MLEQPCSVALSEVLVVFFVVLLVLALAPEAAVECVRQDLCFWLCWPSEMCGNVKYISYGRRPQYNVWTIFTRLHHDLHNGVCLFCMVIDFYLTMVMPKRLAARSSIVDVFISVLGMVSAELTQFHYCDHFLWTICCRMVHSNLNLVSEINVLVETPELVFYICHSHHYSWWLGTILGGQCHIGKHYFSLSEDWGIWPLLALYNMVSIFIYWAEYGHCIGRGIWPLLISSSVMPIFIYWAESGHCFTIGTFGFHRVHL